MPVRRLILAAAAAFLLITAAASARPSASGIELRDGKGRAVITLKGAALGTVERGRITVALRAGPTQWRVDGWDWTRRLPSGEVVYGGEGIRFRFFRGSWKLSIQGQGIDASAAGRGTVVLRGTGEYALEGGPPQPWPTSARAIPLGPKAARADG